MKIGTKLVGSFLLIVTIFGAICLYMVISIQRLQILEDEASARSDDAILLHDIEGFVVGAYGVIADGVINRNLGEFKANFADLKKNAALRTGEVYGAVDTEEERALAADFERAIGAYLATVEKELIPILEKQESIEERAEDALAVKDIAIEIGDVYGIMADAVINRDFEDTRTAFDAVKSKAETSIIEISSMVDTDEERADADRFASFYREYLRLFEAEMLPALIAGSDVSAIRAIDDRIDSTRDTVLSSLAEITASIDIEMHAVLQDENKIREIDETIDGLRDATIAPLELIVEHLATEQMESALMFDQVIRRIILIAAIVSIVGIVAALSLALFITRSITLPLGRVTEISNKIAIGDFTVEKLTTRSKDEIGTLARSFGEMTDALVEKAETIRKIAGGDLSVEIKQASEVDGLGQSLDTMVESLNALLGEVKMAVDQVTSGSNQVAQAGQSLSQGATEQASSLEEIGSSLTQINSQSQKNSETATEANNVAASAAKNAQEGKRKMGDLMDAMSRIDESSIEISKVVKVIDDIAFQINLLALNANVEAARAGKYGKGFAVVADEVRNLAIRSANAVKETSGMVERTISSITDGTKSANDTSSQLDEIVSGSTKVAEYLAEIALASTEQAQGVQQINSGLDQIDQVTQANTASAEESASAAEELSAQAMRMSELIGRFTLRAEESSDLSITSDASWEESLIPIGSHP